MIKVVKFGGTSVGTSARLRRAAKGIARQVGRGNSVVVVVSAMGSSTDDTLDLLDSLKVDVSHHAKDEILSLGERMSVRLLWALLEADGVDSVFLDPSMEEWPVVSDSNFGDAAVNLEATRENCRKYLKPLLASGRTPVVCGFLGRDPEGRVTTLGRGASDQTAFLIGHCLEADEVIVVTDVEGVMSADPRIVRDTRLLNSIYVEELWDLSVGGARVMNSRALRYKLEGQRARIVHYRSRDLDLGGTEIMGSAASVSEVVVDERPVCPVTVVGDEMSGVPGLLASFADLLSTRGINILSVSTGRWSISFFVEAEKADAAVKTLHRAVLSGGPAKAVTKGNRCAMITIAGREFIQTPGIISHALAPLAEKRVNVVEVSTSRAEITIFVNWKNRRTAVDLIKDSVSEMGL